MAINLLDTAKGYLTDAVVSRVSGSLGEDPEQIHKALTGALPVFLGGLISRSSSPDGPGLLTSLTERYMANAAATSQSTDNDDPDTLISQGSDLPDAVFGPKSNLISGAVAQFSGVKSTSASSLLSMAGSVIMGLVGRQLTAQGGGVNAGSLMGLLSGQREAVAAAMPAGLSSLLGTNADPGEMTGMVGGLSGAASSPVTGAASAMGAALSADTSGPVPSASNETRNRVPSTPAYSDNIHDRPKGFNVWPWLLAALAAGLLFYFMRGGGDTADTIATTANDTTSASVPDATITADSVDSSVDAVVDSASSSVRTAAGEAGDALVGTAASLGTFGPRKLPDGIELNIPANGLENKLIDFIDDQSKAVDKTTWFNFDRLQYETGSATLRPESREQLQNIAAILKAYPAVTLKIGGYTDNTGNAAANKKLSQSRAEAAMTELVRLGVAQDRLEAEGYGPQHPIASNTTEEGRAQNRRTAIRVTKK